MEYIIKKATKKDISILIKFKLDTIITNQITTKEKTKIEKYVLNSINKNYKSYKIILINNNIIGAYLVMPYNNIDLLLDEIYMINEYRNRGIGSAIIADIMKNTKKAIYLWVYKDNANAIKLYEALGFIIIQNTETRFQMVYKPPINIINTPEKLYKLMKDINYGWVDKDNNKYDDVNKTFAEKYILQSPNQVLENKIGICWDQVELERFFFEKFNLKYQSFFIVYYNNMDCPTHTFITFERNNKFYWFEHSWEKYRGIHEYDEFDNLIIDIKNKFIIDIKNIDMNNLCLFKYIKPKYHISCIEFYKHCEEKSSDIFV
jgi:predicted acetyltransferase